MSKKVYLGNSKGKLLEGVNLLADAVQSTLGPSGKTVIIKNDGEEEIITKDGVTVAEAMNHPDPVIDLAIQLIKKAASKMNLDSGDGTTTVTVICRKFIELGMELREDPNYNDHDFKIQVHYCLENTIKLIEKNAKKVKLSDVKRIATTSANNDKFLGGLFQEAFDNAGVQGYINIVESVTGKSYVDIVKGFVVDMGYADRKYANNPLTNFFEAEKANILLIDNELNAKAEILSIIKYFDNKATQLPLIIVAKEYSKVVSSIVDFNNRDRVGHKICLIKNQLRNEEYSFLMEDISNYTGAEIIKEFNEFDVEPGIAENVLIKQGATIFGEVTGVRADLLRQHIERLSQSAEVEKIPAYADAIKKRVSKMTTGITTFYVGADSDIELKEKKHRVDDAYHACKGALESKIIFGGGQSLVMASKEFKPKSFHHMYEKYQKVFYQAIEEPFFQILRNSSHSDLDREFIFKEIKWDEGYDAKARLKCNLYKAGVVDPTKVIINALKNAVSIALTILSTECIIVETPQQFQ